MDYTSLLHLLSTLSWNISSGLEDNIIPICSDTNQTLNDTFFIYHDDFSQKSLKQHECSCHIIGKSRIEIQHLTLINKENTTLHVTNHNSKNNKLDLKATGTSKCHVQDKCSIRIQNNGTIKFTENGGIAQFLFKVSKKFDLKLMCKYKSTVITHPSMVEIEKENTTFNDQIPLPVPVNNSNNKISGINIVFILTGIGILVILSILIHVIIYRKYRQKNTFPEKVPEVIPEKTSEIKCAQVSESKPGEEDYEFCEIPEYYTICKDKPKPEPTIPNLPSKPPPLKQESVDFTTSSDSDDRKSNTQIDQTSTEQTERYSNFQLESKPIQGETNSTHTVDNQSLLLESSHCDYEIVNDNEEDTYNHLESVLSPKISIKNSFSEESPKLDLKVKKFQDGENVGNLEIMILDNSDSNDVNDTKKPDIKNQIGQSSNEDDGIVELSGPSSNQDDGIVELRSKASSSSRSLSDTKLLNNSDKCELVPSTKSCSYQVDNKYPDMIITENDLYESMDG